MNAGMELLLLRVDVYSTTKGTKKLLMGVSIEIIFCSYRSRKNITGLFLIF